jgi:hypothetical protein
VASILGRLNSPATLRIVELPGLPEGGDIVDWIETRRDTPKDAKRAEVERLAEGAPPWKLPAELPQYEPPEQEDLRYRPPPLDVLPDSIREYVACAAQAIGCDPSFVLLPVLVVLAGAIGGNSRRLELKRGYQVPPILWVAIVGESGTGKTPALQQVLQPIHDMQQLAFDRYKAALDCHQAEVARWEKACGAWRRDETTEQPPPEKPQPPVLERLLVSDTTVEALAPILLDNPRGLLLARDELAAWLSSFDRYANKGRVSTDAANWLSIFSAQAIIVDRKTDTRRTLRVPRAAVSIIGGIQPGILRRVLRQEYREAGLLARLLLAYPPRKHRCWTEAGIPANVEAEFAELLQRLGLMATSSPW